MTDISWDNGGPVFRDGKIGTGQGCCCGKGACCTCSSEQEVWSYTYTGEEHAELQSFCTLEEAMARYDVLLADTAARASSAAGLLSANGWICTLTDGSVFSDAISNGGENSPLVNEECAPDGVVYRNRAESWTVRARCCGTVDTEAEPIDIGDGVQAYPCVGPYVYDICTDGVSESDCCGVYHATKACQDDPCVGGVCCLSGGTCTDEYTTREGCEECTVTYTCTEYLNQEDPEAPCPEGWSGGGGFCYRTTTPESCESCAGDCQTSESGPCGTWSPGGNCESSPCCASGEDCPYPDPECTDVPRVCCDNVCKDWACFPGIWIQHTVRRLPDSEECPASTRPDFPPEETITFFGSVQMNQCDDVTSLESGGFVCGANVTLLREGCDVSSFIWNPFPKPVPCVGGCLLCANGCFELLEWSHGRQDPNGGPLGVDWQPCT